MVSEAREVVERPTLDGVRAEVARAREVREADSATMIATTTTEMQLHAPHVDYRPVYVGTITEKTTIMANKGKPRAGATSAAVTSTKTSRLCPVDDDGNRYFNDDDNDAVGVYGGWDRDGGIESQD